MKLNVKNVLENLALLLLKAYRLLLLKQIMLR